MQAQGTAAASTQAGCHVQQQATQVPTDYCMQQVCDCQCLTVHGNSLVCMRRSACMFMTTRMETEEQLPTCVLI